MWKHLLPVIAPLRTSFPWSMRVKLESLTDRAANALARLRLVALREENAFLRRGIRVAMDGTEPAALPAI